MEAGESIDNDGRSATDKLPSDHVNTDGKTHAAVDLTIINGIPAMEAGTAQPHPAMAELTSPGNHGGPTKEHPVLSSIDPAVVSSDYNTPTQGQATPATAEDLASFDSLLASLMPTPQTGSPSDHHKSVRNEGQSSSDSTSDEHAQSFVDTILRQAHMYPTSTQDGVAAQAAAESDSEAQAQEPASDDALAASLEQFMASLQARVSSTLTAEGEPPSTPAKTHRLPKKPRKILGKRKYREIGPFERKDRVKDALAEYLSSIDPTVKPALVTGPIPSSDRETSKMTTIRCLHASVAQKSYGSEKRYFNPPPIVSVTGPLRRYAENGSATLTTSLADEDADEEDKSKVSFLVKGEGNTYYSDEHIANLDERLETKIRSLFVAPTGKSKSFRLQLNLLRPSGLEPHHPILSPLKKVRMDQAHSPSGPSSNRSGVEESEHVGESISRLPNGVTWASFESAPVTIISKSSKKTAKPRGQSTQVQNGSLISLFNRINSQTARTKYMHSAPDGRLIGHNGEWSTYRITLISRPPLADLAGAEEGSVTYGSTIVLTDLNTGFSSDPLVVCKVDKGQVQLPQIDPPAELLTAGTGNKSRRVAIDPSLHQKLAAMSASSAKKPNQPDSTTTQPNGTDPAPTVPETGSEESPVGDGLVVDKSTDASKTGKDGDVTKSPSNAEDLNLYGPVGQLQKVALMRFVPSSDSDTISGDSEHLESDFSSPRSYLCGSVAGQWKHLTSPAQIGQEPLTVDYASTHQVGFGNSDGLTTFTDAHKTADSSSLAYVSPKTTVLPKVHSSGTKVVDEVDDMFIWTVIGISRFEYSYFDTSATQASKDEGPCEVPMAPFPLITSMPTYDQTKHTIQTSVTNFIVPAAVTSNPIPLDVWIGSVGPLRVEHSAKTASDDASGDPEHLIIVHVPPIRDLLAAAQANTADQTIPPHFLLPFVFVNDSDGTVYHSGRHVVCEDLVQLMKATGHDTSADMLNLLGFGLGSIAGTPSQGAWSLRII